MDNKKSSEHLKREMEYIDVKKLIPYAKNSRIHSTKQINQIVESIKEFGFTNPVLIDTECNIIAGHGRVLAAQKLKLDVVPCIVLDNLTEKQIKAYVIADNKLALNAGWDDELLKAELEDLEDMEFDLDILGFDDTELADLLGETDEEGLTDEDSVPTLEKKTNSKLGDIYQLGNHRLMCGDSTDAGSVALLMNGEKVDMLFTDPPYGISIVTNSKVGGGGAFGGKKNQKKDKSNVIESSNFKPIIGDKTIDVAVKVIEIIKTLEINVEIIWGGNYYATFLDNSPCWIVWDKKNSGNFADCELAWTNQKTAVRKFEHMWNGMVKASEHGQKRVHPTQKPIALAEWCFGEYGEKCISVLDLFGGSGSTLIACEKTDRNCYMMELDPHYVDVIVKRWEEYTGEKAVKIDG